MKKVIASPDAPKAVGPYSQAIEAGGTLYISGQLPINPADGKIPETIEDRTVARQYRRHSEGGRIYVRGCREDDRASG